MSISWKKIVNSVHAQTGKFLIAVSGGVDSMLLLDVISKSNIDKSSYSVVHFDHGIRDESVEDAIFVKNKCDEYGIKCFVGLSRKLKGNNNLEKLAREARWSYFENVANINGYDTVLTAHHLNDYVENYIIGNIRGIDIKSCIMPKLWKNNNVFRFKPFLMDLSKEQIIKEATRRKLEWKEDITNGDNHHLRNMVRNNIIPEMMKSHNVLVTIPNVIKTIESGMYD